MDPIVQPLEELIAWASESDSIRTMWLTGSRVDPARSPDSLSDYDIGLFVRALQPFVDDDAWIKRFGVPIVQWPEHAGPTLDQDVVTALVQYESGIRIDFQIAEEPPNLPRVRQEGYRVLVDKDGIFRSLSQMQAPRFTIVPPTETVFNMRVNGFWWDIIYVAKALCRDELNFAKYMLDRVIRFEQLQPITEWYIGITLGWENDCGVHGRWFHRLLPREVWESYLTTFAGSGVEENWRAIFSTLDFVRATAIAVASKLSFHYPQATDSAVNAHIDKLYEMYSSRRLR